MLYCCACRHPSHKTKGHPIGLGTPRPNSRYCDMCYKAGHITP